MGTPWRICHRGLREVSCAGWVLGLLVTEDLLPSPPWANGWGAGFWHWAVFTPGEEGTSTVHRRFILSYSCSEVVLQMICQGDKNKSLQAHPQTWVSRNTAPLPLACPHLLPSLECSMPGPASSLSPSHWCVKGRTILALAEVAHPSEASCLYQDRTSQWSTKVSPAATAPRHSPKQKADPVLRDKLEHLPHDPTGYTGVFLLFIQLLQFISESIFHYIIQSVTVLLARD